MVIKVILPLNAVVRCAYDSECYMGSTMLNWMDDYETKLVPMEEKREFDHKLLLLSLFCTTGKRY